jgi:hypothetical protein
VWVWEERGGVGGEGYVEWWSGGVVDGLVNPLLVELTSCRTHFLLNSLLAEPTSC